MVRPGCRLHAPRPVVEPRPAATVLLVRDRRTGGRSSATQSHARSHAQPGAQYEVLLTRRSPNASFGPDASVFPGGTVDAQDGSALAGQISRARPSQSAELRRSAVAAVREVFEEVGILLATHANGAAVRPEQVRALDRDPSARFHEQIRDAGLTLAIDELAWLADWTTGPESPKRFATRFFVARAPAGQMASPDGVEQFDAIWLTPDEALARMAAGTLSLMFPTRRTLERIRQWPTIDALMAACGDAQPLWQSTARHATRNGREVRIEPSELPYAELELVAPDGQAPHAIDWQHEQAVALTRHVRRLTAPNPGTMTGPGTNTYIIGDIDTGFVVVDPGPDDEAHVARIHAIVGNRLEAIVCTHSHADHAPGAWPLARLTGAPVLGLPSAPTAAPSARFVPDRALADDETLTLGSSSSAPTTLRIVHTPGHAANHLCVHLVEDGLLLSGDHILGGTTTVINPPDGDLVRFLDSLRRLDALDAEYILPAHGYVVGSPRRTIEHLISHRQRREERVIDALTAHREASTSGATLDELLPHAYADTPVALHPVAARSLLAHLRKLQAEGRASERPDGRWYRVG